MRIADMKPNAECIVGLSYGKDSIAAIYVAKEILGLNVVGAIHSEVWATQDIPADLPPMVEFKKYADKIIKDRWGIEVQHICAVKKPGKVYGVFKRPCEWEDKLSYEDLFYTKLTKGKHIGSNKGFPQTALGQWCRHLKHTEADLRRYILSVEEASSERGGQEETTSQPIGFATKWSQYCTGQLKRFSDKSVNDGRNKDIIQMLGIAYDEPKRVEKHIDRTDVILPLYEAEWTEPMCRKWCEENNLLSPIYTTATRGGCWFCHNQGVQQLRLLRRNYPELWQILLRWDSDSPTTFHPDGHTVHDFERRFQMEDDGIISADDNVFRWAMLDDEFQLKINFGRYFE